MTHHPGNRGPAAPKELLLATTFVELADTLHDDFDVLDFLQNLVTRSAEIMGADAAALVLADPRGVLHPMASTTHAARVLELLAVAIAEGPCVEAFEHGSLVVNVPHDVSAARWPQFTASADELGFRCCQVVPMKLRSEVLGALNVLFRSEVVLDDADVTILEALASVATIGLLQERTPRQKELLVAHLQTALNQRVTIEQAKGVVAELTDTDVAVAFDLITAFTRRAGRTLGEVARDVLEGRLGTDDLGGHPDGTGRT